MLKVVNSTVKKTDAIPVVIVNSLVMRPINNCTTMGNALHKGKSLDLRGTEE